MAARGRVSLKDRSRRADEVSYLSFPPEGMTNYSRAERSNGPSQVSHPFGRAEERRARGGQEHCKMLLLRELACGSCLSVLSEAKVASSAAPPLDRAPQVARSEAQGHGQWGRLFLRQVLLAEQKKVAALPGALPGLRPQCKRRRQLINAADNSTAASPHRLAGPPRPLPKGEGVKRRTRSRSGAQVGRRVRVSLSERQRVQIQSRRPQSSSTKP
ncbi:hypothetical protein ABIE13_000978 [Ottowia thiooxydans]|uniref:Uncharacterized protein n=1 Tax=Ottowia thiooxydans TaxID=219182 RepID=A0ABV2Q5N1_9BURK